MVQLKIFKIDSNCNGVGSLQHHPYWLQFVCFFLHYNTLAKDY